MNLTSIDVMRKGKRKKVKRCGRGIWQSYKGRQNIDEKVPINLNVKLVSIQKAIELVTNAQHLIMDTGVDVNVNAELLKGLNMLFVSPAESIEEIYYICHHEVGCVQVLLSTAAVTTYDHTEGIDTFPLSILQIVNISTVSILFLLLVCVSLTYVCWKYEVSCKNRERRTVHINTIYPTESRNHAHQEEAHEYEGVDDGCLNRESSIYDGHRAKSSGSSARGSGICGIDSDGYLNAYHALKSIEFEVENTQYTDQSSTGTSFRHA
ncbi:unnamed protein product [Mytilus coruscus]|uniref:Uncharacterized protein n=1 Tax=Mytilus coruscus TaxID=42192 RepID=A0A6J8EYP6_MYTCO|nr:unnamed protein product [Mytilus coruscus]